MKTKLFLLLALSATLGPSSAQNQRVVDSLRAALATRVAGDRYAPSYELAFQFLDADNHRALKMISEAEKAALLSGDTLWIVRSKRVKGQILQKLERSDEAISVFEAALPVARRNGFKREFKFICNTFGLAYWFTGKMDKALEKFGLVLDLSEHEKDTAYLAMSLNNMGIMYYHLHDPRKALTYLLRAWDIRQKSSQPLHITPAINISLCYSFLHEYSEAALFLQKSRDECAGDSSDYLRMHHAFVAGKISYGVHEDDRALNQFLESLAHAKTIRDARMILDNVILISIILRAQGKLQEAEVYLRDAENLVHDRTPFVQSMIELYSQFCQVYRKMNNYERLAFYQEKYLSWKDSLFTYELTNKLMTAEAAFKERENNTKIASQQQIIFLNQGIIHRQKLLNIVTVLLAVVTLAFAVFVFLSYKRKQHLNKLLEQKVRERTLELERSRDEMLKALEEKDLRMRQASYAITTSVNSIEGLCLTGRREVSLPLIHSYLQRIGNASRAIVGNVEEYLRHGVLQEVS
jgi:tetratricopeptide (TPR) repeat protein